MNKITTLGQQYCRMSCDKRIRGCGVAREIGSDWCPKCEGVVYERESDGTAVRFRGGYIPVPIKHGRAMHYACDCEVGKLRQSKGVKKYLFPDNDMCFSERIHQQLLAQWERCNLENRPSYSNIKEVIARIIATLKEREETVDENPF